MAVDGYLNFDTQINTSGFEKGTESILKTLNILDKTIKGLAAAIKSVSDIKFTADTSQSDKAVSDTIKAVESIPNPEIKIEADTSAIKAQIEAVSNGIHDVECDVNVSTSDAVQAVNGINNDLNSLDNKQVSPEIEPDISSMDFLPNNFQSAMDHISESSEKTTKEISEAGGHMNKSIRNLVNIFSSKEDFLWDALQVSTIRSNYCRKSDPVFVEKMNKLKPDNMEKIKELWYRGNMYDADRHYSETRYHAFYVQ